jgi:predicted DNA-binding transcriptional regulator YafY
MASHREIATRIRRLRTLLATADAVTVADLAAQLGASPRTVARDLEALRASGVRVDSAAGRGGGLRLVASRSPVPLDVTGDEVVALWLTVQLGKMTTGLPWSAAASGAMRKLLASLPRERARQLQLLCDRVVVGPAASEAVRTSSGESHPALLTHFERAFTATRVLEIEYVDRFGASSTRQIEPHGLLVQAPVWYVLAWDRLRRAPRSFRMDRITQVGIRHDLGFAPRTEVVQALTPG